MPEKISTDKPKPTSFQIAQPQIPGVPRERTEAEKRRWLYLWVGATIAAVILLVIMIWWARASARAAHPATAVEAPANTAPVASPLRSTPTLPVAPGTVATTEELSHSWATQKFTYRNAPGDTFPAMVVRLPGNAYWAFSLRAPYGTCDLQFVTDMQELRSTYKFDAAHPMVADPCTHTLYDLTKYGSGPNGLVRGAVVAGTGIRPPIAIEVQIKGHEILATRAEKQY
ncbi:MAG TPA: hypothetical protein VND42_03535 [Candidatus Acidoferrales bacterium]|nr:hypothetical protein [Candidatus Acidoferrales bacterium]